MSGYAPQTPNPAAGASSTAITADNTVPERVVNYRCGECDSVVKISVGNALIRCKECGYRVVYKERTNRMVQFEAR